MEKPKYVEPSETWEHYELYKNVENALYSVPNYFQSDTNISGLNAGDVFNLNSVLATTIETNVVSTLNDMRSVWDKNNEYSSYRFIRQSQTFPDVLLVDDSLDDAEPLMGIELKGWYLLSKEKEPSFRYKVTPDACNEQDILAVFPWSLENAITGSPKIYRPFITSAKYASKYVDYYWLEQRDADGEINRPNNVSPYPKSSERIQDKPTDDSGNNYGRLSRSGLMDDYNNSLKNTEVSGIKSSDWVSFFKEVTKDTSSKVDEVNDDLSRWVN